MDKCRELILQYSNYTEVFDTYALWNWIKDNGVTSMNTINCTLSKMVEDSTLSRVAKGRYAAVGKKSLFKAEALENEQNTFKFLKEKLPFAKICVYNGSVIAPLQHHIAENNITYVEADRDITESVFELLKQTTENVWFSPNADMVSRYINLKNKGYIVKTLVTESPVEYIDGITVPTLEKLLVDIVKDNDFSYLQGTETERIWENARELYVINDSRLKRYARRRGLQRRFLFDAPIAWRHSQTFNIGRLFDKSDDIGVAIGAFRKIAPVELGYRNMDTADLDPILDDIFNTSLIISMRGLLEKDKFTMLQEGIKSIGSFVYKQSYHIENAIVDASKAAYLSVLIKNGITTIEHYDGNPLSVAELKIANSLPSKINKLKMGNPEAFFYWAKASEIIVHI